MATHLVVNNVRVLDGFVLVHACKALLLYSSDIEDVCCCNNAV